MRAAVACILSSAAFVSDAHSTDPDRDFELKLPRNLPLRLSTPSGGQRFGLTVYARFTVERRAEERRNEWNAVVTG